MPELQATQSATNRIPLRFMLAFALWCGALPSLFGVTFTATLDRNSVVVGEGVTLTLSFEGGSPQEISPLPEINGLQVASGVSSSVNSSVTPTGSVTIQSYTVTLVPKRVGKFVIPPFHAKVSGENLSSQPLTLTALASDPSAPPPSFASKPAFLWLSLPKKQLVAGETLIAELRLYIRGDIRRISSPQIPIAGDGFTFSKMVEGQHFQRNVGTSPFTIIPYSVALTPVKTGALTLGPIDGSIVLNARGPFDFDGFFGSSTPPQQAALHLDPQTLQVSPLPNEHVPADFTGAVGQYTLSVSAGPTNVAVGDPITVRILISGKGALDTLSFPAQADWQDFKIYPPTTKIDANDQFGIQGTKTFEEVVVPQSVEVKQVPAVSFSYFDDDKGKYETLTQPPIALTVRPGGSSPAPTILANRIATDAPPSSDIVPLKQRLGTVAEISAPLVRQTWFLTLQSVPLVAFLGALIWRKRTESLANNPRLRRRRLVAQIVRDGLGELRQHAAANQSDEFFATLFRLLQEQLGERLDLPATAITEAVVEEQLIPRGVPEGTTTALRELFQACNLARYAPIKSSQELAAFIPRLEAVLQELQEVKL